MGLRWERVVNRTWRGYDTAGEPVGQVLGVPAQRWSWNGHLRGWGRDGVVGRGYETAEEAQRAVDEAHDRASEG